MQNKISFVINTGPNTLPYVKLLLTSLKEQLDDNHHEILIFVDNDNDGTLEYLRTNKENFYDLKIVSHKIKPIVGYARNSDLMVKLAKHDIVSYLQSDMVVSKHYDSEIIRALEENTILSSTRIEPPLHGISDKTFTMDFGVDPEHFKYSEFVQFADTIKSDKQIEYFFAPYTFHKSTWKKLGGYDTLFRRAREDSDFVQRCLHANVKLKQTFSANVYHFTCVSSRGKNWFDKSNQEAQDRVKLQSLADQMEIRRFVKKWGNFNHGESVLKKYDCDLVIKSKIEKIGRAFELEPFFSRVWIQSENQRQQLITNYQGEHFPANKLLNFTEEDWQDSKKYYNQIDYSSIYLVGEPENYNAKIELNLDSKEPDLLTGETLMNLGQLIEQTEPGDYEFGNCILSIKQAKEITPSFKVENPPFDMDLLTIE